MNKHLIKDFDFLNRFDTYDLEMKRKVWEILSPEIQKRLKMKMEGRMK